MEFPRRHVPALQHTAVRLLDSRKPGTELEHLARDLLRALEQVCARGGLDAIEAALDVDVREADLVARLRALDIDGGGPRAAKPRELTEATLAAADLVVTDEPDRSISLGADVRAAVTAGIAAVVDAALAPPQLRETIIAEARARTEERFHPAFTKVVAQLDDRGEQLTRLAKVPIDALHATQHALADARHAVIARVTDAALERVTPLLGDEAAARIDQPITVRSTPREVAVLRTADPRVGLAPAKVVHALVESLTDLIPITWRAAELPVTPYSPSKTFAVGDLIDHPKFGRGTVVAALAQKIDVEFADGKRALAHVPPRR